MEKECKWKSINEQKYIKTQVLKANRLIKRNFINNPDIHGRCLWEELDNMERENIEITEEIVEQLMEKWKR